MAIVVIGGQSKNIGKTAVVCALIAAMPERRWTAIKISPAYGEPEATVAHTGAIEEECNASKGTDSSRYLAAGAARSFWARTSAGQLAEAMPGIRAAMAGAENVVLESNSILEWLQPDVYAIVLDPRIADFKASALRYLTRADAVLRCGGGAPSGDVLWALEHKPRFQIAPPDYCSVEFNSFVAQKLERVGRSSLPTQ
jgi:hypothetical protein